MMWCKCQRLPQVCAISKLSFCELAKALLLSGGKLRAWEEIKERKLHDATQTYSCRSVACEQIKERWFTKKPLCDSSLAALALDPTIDTDALFQDKKELPLLHYKDRVAACYKKRLFESEKFLAKKQAAAARAKEKAKPKPLASSSVHPPAAEVVMVDNDSDADDQLGPEPVVEEVVPKKKQRLSLSDRAKVICAPQDRPVSSAESTEIAKFKLISSEDILKACDDNGDFDILKLYTQKQDELPAHTIAVQRTYSHIPSEACSEREFNHSKEFLKDNRSTTHAEHVKEVMFVGRNWKHDFLRPTWQEVLAKHMELRKLCRWDQAISDD